MLKTLNKKVVQNNARQILLVLAVFAIFFVFVPSAHAASMATTNDTLSTAVANTTANHTVKFVTPTGIGSGSTVTLTFPATSFTMGASLTGVTIADNMGTAYAVTSASWSAPTLTITASATSLVVAGHTATITIPTTQITNPAVLGSNTITIGGTFGDTGSMAVVIVANDGSLLSQVFYNSAQPTFTTFAWVDDTGSKPATSLKMQIRGGNTATPDSTWTDWLGDEGTYATNLVNGNSISFLGQEQYVQYKAYFTSTDVNIVPYLTSATIGYTSAGFLTGSPYNIGADNAQVTGLTWAQTLPGGSYLGLQVRTSPNNSAWTAWMGPDGTIGTFFTDPATVSLPAALTDGTNDRWVQYRILLKSTNGVNVPTVTSVSVGYAVMVPSVTSINPSSITNIFSPNTVTMNIVGVDFVTGATAKLVKGGITINSTSLTVTDANNITATFPLTTASAGAWDVTVTNPSNAAPATLAGGFTIQYDSPAITTSTPASVIDVMSSPVTLTISGDRYYAGITAKLVNGGTTINATSVNISDVQHMTATFNLSTAFLGSWNLVLQNTTGAATTSTGAFTISNDAPAITNSSPGSVADIAVSPTTLTVNGDRFYSGITAKLVNGGTTINGTGVIVNSINQMHATFDLSTAFSGNWNLVLQNNFGSATTLTGGFAINNNIGTLTSQVFNAGGLVDFSLMNWNADTTQAGTSVSMKVQAGTATTPDTDSDSVDGSTWTHWYTVTNPAGSDIFQFSQKRYIRYRATMTTSGITNVLAGYAPKLNSVSMLYGGTGSLTSSPYKVDDTASVVVDGLRWTESLPANTGVKLQLRTAPNNGGVPGNYNDWMGPDGTGGTYFTNSASGCSGSGTITCAVDTSTGIASGQNSQWAQYRVWLVTTDTINMPTVSNVELDFSTMDSPTNPKQYRSNGTTEIATANWTNENSVKLSTSMTGLTSSTSLTPQIELVKDTPTFTGMPGYPAGASGSADAVGYSGTAVTGVANVNLAEGTYYWKGRTIDQGGRVSAWSDYNSFRVDYTKPTFAGIAVTPITMNGGVAYTSTANVNVAITTAADTGGSNLKELYFSNDGVVWTNVTPGSGFSGETTYTGNIDWALEPGDGIKGIYVKATDEAGNVSGNDPQTAAFTLTLDIHNPGSFALLGPANGIWQQALRPTFTWEPAVDDVSGIAKYQLWLDGSLYQDNIAADVYTFSPNTNLIQMNHTWQVVVVDKAGNTTTSSGSAWTIGVDSLKPSSQLSVAFALSVSDDINDRINITWPGYGDTSGSGSPATSYQIDRIKSSKIDGTNYSVLTDNWNDFAGDSSSGYLSRTVAASVHVLTDRPAPDGDIEASTNYIYRIRVTDTAGNVSNWQDSSNWHKLGLTKDLTPPPFPTSVTANACDGVDNCSVDGSIPHNGYEIKLTWNPSTDTGAGTVGYLIYRRAVTDSSVSSDYSLVGYLHSMQGSGSTTYYDNDATLATEEHETIEGADVVIKAAGDTSLRLNDHTDYFYRIIAIDALGNKFVDVISRSDANHPPVVVTGINQATAQTPDVTSPSWYVSGTPTLNAGLSATAMGLDGIADDTDPKQRIDVSWQGAMDLNTPGRTPTGNGTGVSSYHLLWAKGNVSGPTDAWQEITLGNVSSYSQPRLEPKPAYYYYKLKVYDASGNVSAESNMSVGAPTLSNDYPSTPQQISVRAVGGDPGLSGSRVGKDIEVSFTGSRIKNVGNLVTGYDVWRSTDPNEADWLNLTPVKTYSNLDLQNDVWDQGEGSCAQVTVPNTEPAVTVHQRCFTDTVPNDGDATTYYYKVRAVAYNIDLVPHVIYSGLSATDPMTLYAGWDTTPDATAPFVNVADLELNVKDTHPNSSILRNIITWKVVDPPLRKKQSFETCTVIDTIGGVQYCSDFARYEVHREVYDQANILMPEMSESFDLTNINDNIYIDEVDVTYQTDKFKYYLVVADNADSEFKYQNPNIPINSFANTTDKIYWNGSITPANSHAVISNVAVQSVSVSSATVTWTTDQDTDSLVEFREAGTSDKFKAIGDRAMVSNHSIDLWGLAPLTTYEYRVVSRNYPFGNETVASSGLPELRTSGFSITPGDVTTTTSTAEISWTTNLDASSAFVEYQLIKQPGDEAQSGGATVTKEDITAHPRNHYVVIKGLRSNRTYTYKIKSISADNYLTEYPIEAFGTFKTRNFDTAQFTIAPNSSNVAERNINATTAQIVWETISPATSWVDYSTTSGVYDVSAGNNDLVTTHVVLLEGLVPGNRYYYRVRVKDANEVEYTSAETSFLAILKPKISNMTIKDITPYSVTIAWDTNVDTETIMNWGTTASYGEKRGKSGVSKVHELLIDNLFDNQEYHYQILAKDEMGNEVADEDKIVRTPLDTEGPKITNVKLDVLPMGENDNTSSVIVSWQTNKPATTLVEYDEGVIGGTYSKQSVEDLSLNNSHTVIIKGLTAASSYHYRLVSADKRLNKTVSQDYTFVTPSKEKSILQLILKSLEETFSWTKNLNQFFGNVWKRLSGR